MFKELNKTPYLSPPLLKSFDLLKFSTSSCQILVLGKSSPPPLTRHLTLLLPFTFSPLPPLSPLNSHINPPLLNQAPKTMTNLPPRVPLHSSLNTTSLPAKSRPSKSAFPKLYPPTPTPSLPRERSINTFIPLIFFLNSQIKEYGELKKNKKEDEDKKTK